MTTIAFLITATCLTTVWAQSDTVHAEFVKNRDEEFRAIRKWVSVDGKYSVRAHLTEFDGQTVVLKKEDGTTLTLTSDKLCRRDNAWLVDYAEHRKELAGLMRTYETNSLDEIIDKQRQEVLAKQEEELANRKAKVEQQTFSNDDLSITLIGGVVGQVLLKDVQGTATQSEDELLQLVFRVQNASDKKILYCEGRNQFKPNFQLEDADGNLIKGVHFGVNSMLYGLDDRSLRPGEMEIHFEPFHLPPDAVRQLNVRVDLEKFGSSGSVDFKLDTNELMTMDELISFAKELKEEQ